ncbi:hypothetical protein GW17_00047851, partial [Ensete ventricosum]
PAATKNSNLFSPKPQSSTLDPPPLSTINPPNRFITLTQQQEKDIDISDLEAYAMTSQGSIDAKLEAFESRVENRLRALFAEFGLGRSPSPTKFQQSVSLEMPLKKKERATDMRQPRMREDFPRWEEGDLTGWISHAERYFHHHQTPEDSMVDTAVIHLEGDAIR